MGRPFLRECFFQFMDEVVLLYERILLLVLYGYIVQHFFFESQLRHLKGQRIQREQELAQDAFVVEMQGKSEGLEKGNPVRPGNVFYPDIVVVAKEDPV